MKGAQFFDLEAIADPNTDVSLCLLPHEIPVQMFFFSNLKNHIILFIFNIIFIFL